MRITVIFDVICGYFCEASRHIWWTMQSARLPTYRFANHPTSASPLRTGEKTYAMPSFGVNCSFSWHKDDGEPQQTEAD